ncbi:hypothetical protein DT075_00605 [Bacillus licheniformis]|nr:hypothetical protein DT075_00605 [Bacillus licheniformis]
MVFIAAAENAPFLKIVFEVFSAFGTVGLSMGLTPDLTAAGKAVIMMMMFIGRVGPLTMAFTLAKPKKAPIRH